MKATVFSSSLAEFMRQFVDFRRVEGYDYICGAYELSHFDRFLTEQSFSLSHLTAESLDRYVVFTGGQGAWNRKNRLSAVRFFSRFMHAVDPRSAVLEHIPVKRPLPPRFYLYSDAEIAALLNAALQLRRTSLLRPHCFHMLIGLLAVTGLRISEALALDLRDLDLRQRRLFVRKGKFGKERYVVLDLTTVQRLETYLRFRAPHGGEAPSSPLFLGWKSGRLSYSCARNTFAALRQIAEVGRPSEKPPRLHDLRHTYACNCLGKWRREGVEVNARLPLLATALGHTKIEHTQIYLHVTPQQLREGSERLRNHLNHSTEGK